MPASVAVVVLAVVLAALVLGLGLWAAVGRVFALGVMVFSLHGLAAVRGTKGRRAFY
jgi:hypothetical protein